MSHTLTYTLSHIHTLPHTHSLTVASFCYYQFYCFQDTASLFNQFNAATNDTIISFINTTQIQAVADLICTETEVLREFINTQLPWFEYQEYTWLAIGESISTSNKAEYWYCRYCPHSGVAGSYHFAHCAGKEAAHLYTDNQRGQQVHKSLY